MAKTHLIVYLLLNGWIRIAPVSSWTLLQTDSLDSMLTSLHMIWPPYRLTFSTLQAGAFLGITMCAGMPRSFAARATAAAWFPLRRTTTSIYFCSSGVLEKSKQEHWNYTAPAMCHDALWCLLIIKREYRIWSPSDLECTTKQEDMVPVQQSVKYQMQDIFQSWITHKPEILTPSGSTRTWRTVASQRWCRWMWTTERVSCARTAQCGPAPPWWNRCLQHILGLLCCGHRCRLCFPSGLASFSYISSNAALPMLRLPHHGFKTTGTSAKGPNFFEEIKWIQLTQQIWWIGVSIRGSKRIYYWAQDKKYLHYETEFSSNIQAS